MKPCIRCGETKPITEFYTHPRMGDGHLNKCKLCCREQARMRHYQKSLDAAWVVAERVRHKSKSRRLSHGWRKSQAAEDGVAAHFAAIRAIPRVPPAWERHHWSYRPEHKTDVVLLRRDYHRALHRTIAYDPAVRMFRTRRGARLLDTKRKHVRYAMAAFNVRERYRAAA
jgi:hypothetical protein